ncbi:isoleucine--tRNA ligase, cytoplasmic isoform X1 [Schistocerca nitens]|uniref:isoleucine--tRNA ligase, cytoplasmic isoform X1 n=1 Tax=Schistocerca nitens TaxID=7011 RepID=UPI00211912AE|nr:isoleucine--tRNA ligase, cytoplasmic isoform X1 [Schistocerca nitens]
MLSLSSDKTLVIVPETINFPAEEEIVLAFWKDKNVFKNCLIQSKGKPRFSFYDGPPFATGLPHYGHILAGTVKDIVTRFMHQCGFHVERRFGWDCHGLPVEFEIDNKLGIKGPDDVAKLGIANYNAECRTIVMRYATQWQEIVTRLGRWIDFENDYKTMYPAYMESVWWVFTELFNKGLVYKGVKVMPFSTACNTPLSNFESGQNYKQVQDPAVIVSFPLVDEPDVSLIAWTTTPWTLPSNLLLCVNAKKIYVKVKDKKRESVFILMKARLESLYKKKDQYTILEEFEGCVLKGRQYKPLFKYFLNYESRGAFRVQTDDYVTEESGTGVVHQAPFFGEDDYRISLAAGVLTRDENLMCPVDESGCFVDPVVDFKGQYVKDADKNIIKWVKEAGRLVDNSTTVHQYPFCWRSDTPLIYKCVPSWFIRVQEMTENLLKCVRDTYWVPDFVKEKRFGNWLKDARDWAISRNRYWGTPIPLWISEDGVEVVSIGSIAELQQKSGQKISDIHRESIDHITIPSKRPGCPPLKRVPEVFDCWFESGSMPYAQLHYPFENKQKFKDSFPADFIAEGIDQTRGWFYTLLVISTLLFNKPAYKNLIANGLVLAEDGQKMSKRKKNYPDPMKVVNALGADALRLYLINSPVVRAENLRFKEQGVRDLHKDVFLPWYNAYRFLIQNIVKLKGEGVDLKFDPDERVEESSTNIMDRWILSFTYSLIKFVKNEMEHYRLYTVVPRLIKFIDNLTNWYVRMNRKRLKGAFGVEECTGALNVLFTVLLLMVRIMAPFTPFITETMYQNLRRALKKQNFEGCDNTESVHYLPFPKVRETCIDSDVEKTVARMQTVIDLGRVIRDRKTVPVKYPLPSMIIIHPDEKCITDLMRLRRYIAEELNVRHVTLTTDMAGYGVVRKAEPNYKELGVRFKSELKTITEAVKDFSEDNIQKFIENGHVTLFGHRLESSDIVIKHHFDVVRTKTGKGKFEGDSQDNIIVLLDMEAGKDLQEEGLAREIVNRVQKVRKTAGLLPMDEIVIYYDVKPPKSELSSVAEHYSEYIYGTLKMPFRHRNHIPADADIIKEQTFQVKDAELQVALVSCNRRPKPDVQRNEEPFCRYTNVILNTNGPTKYGTVLLENPVGKLISFHEIVQQVKVLFSLDDEFKLHLPGVGDLDCVNDVTELHTRTLLINQPGGKANTANFLKEDISVRYANVEYILNGRCERGTVLLENPNNSVLKLDEFVNELTELFDLSGYYTLSSPVKIALKQEGNAALFHKKTLFLYPNGNSNIARVQSPGENRS